MISCMLTLVEKTRRSINIWPRPSSKLRKRVTAAVSGADIMVNITTTPPTTLYTP